MNHRSSPATRAFSLVQLSGIVLAAGLVAAAVIPEGDGASQASRYMTTIKHMEKVEEATVKMMARWGRRPCPASGEYYPGNAKFGIEDGTRGDCADSGATDGVLTPFDDTNVIAGTVPIKKLGLPTEYYFDGWGRPLTYAVDKRATQKSQCVALDTVGDVKVFDGNTAGGGTQIDSVMSLLVSHGPDGHGSFQPGGSIRSNRLSAGSTDADQLNNTGASGFDDFDVGNTNPANFVNEWIKRESIGASGYDDVTWYSQKNKNTCCVGKGCQSVASGVLRIDSERANVTSHQFNNDVDVNGDGINDLAIMTIVGRNAQLYVIYGTGDRSYPNPLDLGDVGGSVAGFTLPGPIHRDNSRIKSQDIDGDGNQDLIFARQHTGNSNSAYVTFIFLGGIAGTTYPASFDGTPDGETILRFSTNRNYDLEFVDMNADGFNDVVASGRSVSNTDGAIQITYGKAATGSFATGWGNGITVMDSVPSNTHCEAGFSCTHIYPDASVPSFGWGRYITIGNFNGDTTVGGVPIPDILVTAWINTSEVIDVPTSGDTGRKSHIIFGSETLHTVTNIDVNNDLDGTNGIEFRHILGTRMHNQKMFDINNDGYDDAIFANNNNNASYILFGGPGPRTGAGTFDTVNGWAGVNYPYDYTQLNGTNGLTFRMDGLQTYGHADINDDGLEDLYWGSRDDSSYGNSRGRVQVIWGQSSAYSWPATLTMGSDFTQTMVSDSLGYHGRPLVVGDVNGDSATDIMWPSFSTNSNDGEAGIYLQPSGGWTANLTYAGTDVILSGETGEADVMGSAFGLIDFDSDGKKDVIIGAKNYDTDTVTNAGSLYVIWDGSTIDSGSTTVEVSSSDPVEAY